MKNTWHFVFCLSAATIFGCQAPVDVAENSTEGTAVVPVSAQANAVADKTALTENNPSDMSGKKAMTGSAELPTNEKIAMSESASSDASESKMAHTEETRTQATKTGEYNELGEKASFVILRKGTERRSLEGYTMTHDPGTYICRQCNAMLYRSEDKFDSHCGWPAFDDEIDGAVKRNLDADGRRIEIVCANCDGHLGHVFEGERKTEKNVRHCVNSISMKFIAKGDPIPDKIISPSKAE